MLQINIVRKPDGVCLASLPDLSQTMLAVLSLAENSTLTFETLLM